jgi:AraC-like DNA-binding protein
MQITEFLNFFASINFILSGIILLLFNKRKSSFRILLSLYSIVAGTAILIISFYNYSEPVVSYLVGFEFFIGSCQAPIFILLTKNVLNKEFRFSWSNMLLFIYPLSVLSFLIGQSSSPGYHLNFVNEVQTGKSKIGQVFAGLNFSYILFSVIYGVQILRNKRVFSNIFYSRFEIIRIKWLYRYFMFHLITAPFAAIAFYTLAVKGSGSYFGFLASLIYLFFLYKLLTEPNTVYLPKAKKSLRNWNNENTLDTDIIQILRELLIKEKLFLSKEITLNDLANKLGITPYHLETALSTVESKTCKDYLNSFRLDHARKLLGDDKYRKYTIDYIADLCGFSSRTIFYELFKKEYRLTPLQLRKTCSAASHSLNC